MTDTIETPTLKWPPVEALRDGYGRYAGAIVGGKEHRWSTCRSRVTTITGKIDDKTNLIRWEWERMAEGLALDPSHYITLCDFVNNADSRAIRNYMEAMAEKGGSKDGANRGTRYHEIVGAMLAGAPLPIVSIEEERDARAVVALFEEHHVEVLDLERIVVNRELDYAGTADYRLRFPQFGEPVIGDLKTGSRLDLSYTGYRAQLAAYARASHEVSDDGDLIEAPTVNRDVGFLIHLVPGKGEARFVGANLIDGWRAFRLAHKVWTHGRGRPRTLDFDETLLAHAGIQLNRDVTRSEWVRARVDALRGLKDDPNHHGMRVTHYLASIWPDGVPLPSKCDGWFGDELEQVIAAVHVAENEYQAPFFGADPTK